MKKITTLFLGHLRSLGKLLITFSCIVSPIPHSELIKLGPDWYVGGVLHDYMIGLNQD